MHGFWVATAKQGWNQDVSDTSSTLGASAVGGIEALLAAQSAESGNGWTFLLLYGAEIGVLGIYALCWQQVIKRVELSVAYANRAMALLWSLLWAVLLFGEQITVKKLIGVGLVLAGTLIINGGKEQENHD